MRYDYAKRRRLERYDFRTGGASAHISEVDPGRYALIGLYSENPRQGDAKHLLKIIVDFADEKGFTLILLVRRFGRPNDGMTNEQLEALYSRFGFVREGDPIVPIMMIRHPSRELHGL